MGKSTISMAIYTMAITVSLPEAKSSSTRIHQVIFGKAQDGQARHFRWLVEVVLRLFCNACTCHRWNSGGWWWDMLKQIYSLIFLCKEIHIYGTTCKHINHPKVSSLFGWVYRPSPAALVALSFAPHCGLEIEQKLLGSQEVPGRQLAVEVGYSERKNGAVVGDISYRDTFDILLGM